MQNSYNTRYKSIKLPNNKLYIDLGTNTFTISIQVFKKLTANLKTFKTRTKTIKRKIKDQTKKMIINKFQINRIFYNLYFIRTYYEKCIKYNVSSIQPMHYP